MKKIKIIILSLVCLMIFNGPVSVLAASDKAVDASKSFEHVNEDGSKETITIIQDDENVRIAESIKEDGTKEVVTFNKKTNMITTEINDKETQVVDLGQQMELYQEQVDEQIKLKNDMGVMVTGDSYEHTIMNYEYDIWYRNQGDFWRVTRPDPDNPYFKTKYKEVYSNNYNKDLLDDYRDKVIEINAWEKGALTLMLGTGAIAIVATVATAGIATAAMWAAIGMAAADIPLLITVDILASKAEVIYSKI